MKTMRGWSRPAGRSFSFAARGESAFTGLIGTWLPEEVA